MFPSLHSSFLSGTFMPYHFRNWCKDYIAIICCVYFEKWYSVQCTLSNSSYKLKQKNSISLNLNVIVRFKLSLMQNGQCCGDWAFISLNYFVKWLTKILLAYLSSFPYLLRNPAIFSNRCVWVWICCHTYLMHFAFSLLLNRWKISSKFSHLLLQKEGCLLILCRIHGM